MIIFCGVGLPGFVVSIALPLASLVAIFLSSALVDKVSDQTPIRITEVECPVIEDDSRGFAYLHAIELSLALHNYTRTSFSVWTKAPLLVWFGCDVCLPHCVCQPDTWF